MPDVAATAGQYWTAYTAGVDALETASTGPRHRDPLADDAGRKGQAPGR